MKLSETIVLSFTIALVAVLNMCLDVRQTDQIVELRNRIEQLEQLHNVTAVPKNPSP
jgi:hypothetical protein